MSHETESQWSKEQIASALRLVGAGVPLKEIAQTMGAAPGTVSAWRREYATLLDKLIKRYPKQEGFTETGGTVRIRRMAYISDCIGDEEVESELRACKIRYSIVENTAAAAGELLRSRKMLGNFQRTICPSSIVSTCEAPLENSSENTVLAESQRRSAAKIDCNDLPHVSGTEAEPLVLVSAQIADPGCVMLPRAALASAEALSAVVSGEIDELWWRSSQRGGGHIDEPIIQDSTLEFRLDAILDAPINAIRMFFTSPMDALLIGNCLLQKS